jgi:putative transposase
VPFGSLHLTDGYFASQRRAAAAGFGVHAGTVDGVALCRMSNRAIRGQCRLPKYLNSDNDPLYKFHQWQANLQILEVTEVKIVPYIPCLIPSWKGSFGSIRREYLDHTMFWPTVDLENKLLDFRNHYNHHRTLHSRKGPASQPYHNWWSRLECSCRRPGWE